MPASATKTQTKDGRQKKTKTIASIIGGIVVIAAIIVLVVILRSGDSKTKETTNKPEKPEKPEKEECKLPKFMFNDKCIEKCPGNKKKSMTEGDKP